MRMNFHRTLCIFKLAAEITDASCFLPSFFPKKNVLHFVTFRFDASGLRRTKVILQVIMGCKSFHNSLPAKESPLSVGLKKIKWFLYC